MTCQGRTLVPATHVRQPSRNGGHDPVARTLGLVELRRVGEFELGEVTRREAAAHRRRDDVDAPVRPVAADRLRTADRVGLGVDQEFEGLPLGTRAVPGA
ncbi:hypothetical protein MOPEL_067_00650 [Mobilicoccus pelagius NBRC 104925]|uniref:Uncharacterized protein n=1 Tax=Mobilicoccus pelagius NBRC 104925 TaxID=1089455 RepID=H5UR58_9MICO|nr:hypothetical protein MOPEL_067_00650 [Mobilicoccus pelagius NBRC 104925]